MPKRTAPAAGGATPAERAATLIAIADQRGARARPPASAIARARRFERFVSIASTTCDVLAIVVGIATLAAVGLVLARGG
jgi:hypothetical protein